MENLQIAGIIKECSCEHCGRDLKMGVTIKGRAGAFGAQCIAKMITARLSPDTIKHRAIVASKGEEYSWNQYGWKLDCTIYKLTLKSGVTF